MAHQRFKAIAIPLIAVSPKSCNCWGLHHFARSVGIPYSVMPLGWQIANADALEQGRNDHAPEDRMRTSSSVRLRIVGSILEPRDHHVCAVAECRPCYCEPYAKWYLRSGHSSWLRRNCRGSVAGELHYTLFLPDGKEVQTTRNGPALVTALDDPRFLIGEAIVGMRVGGLRKLIVPPNRGYGSAGVPGLVPPNATLVFDVELVAVQ